MVIWSVVLVDFFPPGDGMAGVYFLPAVTDFLADILPFSLVGVSFFSFPVDLLGVYLRILSTFFLTSPYDSTDFFPAAFPYLAADLEAAFFLPLAPPFTLGAA